MPKTRAELPTRPRRLFGYASSASDQWVDRTRTRRLRPLFAAVLIAALLGAGCAASSGFSVTVERLQTSPATGEDAAAAMPITAMPTAVFVPLPPTVVPATAVPPTAVPPTALPPTALPPTAVPPTAVPPTEVPPTTVPPTEVPPTAVPRTAVPPTPVPATEVPEPTEVPTVSAVDPTEVLEPARQIAEQDYVAFATIEGLTLHLPSARVEHVGFHQAVNTGAQQMTALDSPVFASVLPSRGRGTGSHTAADIVAEPGSTIRSPVTGTVIAANTYVLYCQYDDSIVVIEPDGWPGWETKVLHVSGLQVAAGDRVEAGVTVIASGPTIFPFESQVDDATAAPAWPHVHIETVDTAIPHEGTSVTCD